MQQVVPKECDDDLKQYGATSTFRSPKTVEPPAPAPAQSSVGNMAANAGAVAAKGIAEFGSSLRKFSGSLFSS